MTTGLPSIHWESTGACNLACPGCTRPTGNGELSTGEVFKFLEDSLELGTLYLVVGGGEPFLRKDILDILNHASDLGMIIEVVTKGGLVTPTLVKELEKAQVDSVVINVDHPGAARFDRAAGRPGAFAEAMRGLELLSDSPILTGISARITRDNLHEVDGLMDLAIDRGARFVRLVPAFGCDFMPKPGAIGPGDWEAIASAVIDSALKHKDHFIFKDYEVIPPPSRNLADFFTMSCPAGVASITVLPGGGVSGCEFLPPEKASLKEGGLKEIWNGGFAALRGMQCSQLDGGCNRCGLTGCKGGCVAERIGKGGLYRGQDICVNEILTRAFAGRNSFDMRMITGGWLSMAHNKRIGCIYLLPIWTYFLRDRKRMVPAK